MKKFLLLFITMTILLVGCGSKDLDDFVDKFNQNARKYDATELLKDEFGEIEEEDGDKWRVLFESKEYTLEALYDGNDISGYAINVRSDTDSISKSSKGYNAVLTLADTLGINIKDLEKGMQTAFNENFHSYYDGDYEVRIFVVSVVSTSMTISIEKK